MTFLLFLAWILFHTFLINIALKVGWNHDAGYLGPALIVLVINLTIALYSARIKSGS